ncbi:ATP-dependent endonuclease [Microbacterium sp. NPDC055683]
MRRTVILVEGESDRAALHAAAVRLGEEPPARIGVLHGITNLAKALAAHAGDGVVVLFDGDERARVARVLAGATTTPVAATACERDLEDELIRALGADGVLAVIAAEGDLPAWRALRGQPFHRRRPVEEVLHRFMGSIGGRKLRYARALVEALPPGAIPRPLVDALAAAR